MDPSWMELVLDSIKTYQVQTKQLFEQQKALHLQAVNGILSTEPPQKRRKASKQCYGPEGKENCFTAGSAKDQGKPRTYSSQRQMETLMDSDNLARNLNPCQVTYFRETDEGQVRNELINSQQDLLYHCNLGVVGQSDNVVPQATSLEKMMLILSPPKLNPARRRRRGVAVKAETLSVASDASESLNVLPRAERLEEVNGSSELPCPVAGPVPFRMTRARAKILKNGEGHSVGAQCEEPAKKPRAQKGRAKAIPQVSLGREVEEFATNVANVPLIEEKTTSELVVDGTGGLSGEADELRNEFAMNSFDNVDTVVRKQPVTKQSGKPKPVCKTIHGTSETESGISAVVNMHFEGKKQWGYETVRLYAEEEPGGEDVPTKEHTKNPDGGAMGSVQKEQQVKMSSPLKDIGKAASQTKTPVCDGGDAVQGVAYIPDLRIEMAQDDGGRKSGEAACVSDGLMEDIGLGGEDKVTVPVELLVRKSKAKRGRRKAVAISSRVKVDAAQCTAPARLLQQEGPIIDLLNGTGDCHNGVADGVIHEEVKNLMVGTTYTDLPAGQAKFVTKSAFSHEDEEAADHVVSGAPCVEAENDTLVSLQVDGRMIPLGSGQDARNEAVIEGSITLEELQTVAAVKKPHGYTGNLCAAPNDKSTHIAGVNSSLEDVQQTEDNKTFQSVEAHSDRYNERIAGSLIELKREDEDDILSADLDSERWEDIKRSATVRKGRGRAVSSFLGYEDSDLFPPRSLAIGRNNDFDLALEEDMEDIQNAGPPEEGIKDVMDIARSFSDLLQKIEAGALDSTKSALRRVLELGGGRKGEGEDGRQSGASLGELLVASHTTIPVEAVKGRIGTDEIQEFAVASGKRRVVGMPGSGMGLEQEMGCRVTPGALSQGSGPITESLERAAGAVVSGSGFRHLVKELKLELESTEPRNLSTEIVIDLSPGDRSGTALEIVQDKPRPMSGYSRGRGHDSDLGEQAEVSTYKGQSTGWTVELNGGSKRVPFGDIKIGSSGKQGLEMFGDKRMENVQVDPNPLEALEPDMISEIEKLQFISLEQIRKGSGYEGDDASPTPDAGLRGIKLRIRPFSEFCDARASTYSKARSDFTSVEGGEHGRLDDGQAISRLESEEGLILGSFKLRQAQTAENTSPVDMTPIRKDVSPWNGEPSYRRPPLSSQMKSNKSTAQMAVGGDWNLFKEVFTFKTPLRSQRRNVTELSPDCQSSSQEASPSFHVPDARRSCKSGSLNSRPSQIHHTRASSRVRECEAGPSGSPPDERSNRVVPSGEHLLYESTNDSPIVKMSEKTIFHDDFSSPARIDFRDDSGLRRIVDKDQYKSGRYGNLSPDSLRKGKKLDSQTKGAAVSTGLLGYTNRIVSPQQQLRNENWSGDTMVLSDADDQDTLTSTEKSLDSSRQGEKGESPACSPCEPGKLSGSMTVTLENLNPGEVSLRHGVPRPDSDLEMKEIVSSSNSKCLQLLKDGSGRSEVEIKGKRNAVPRKYRVKDTSWSGELKEKVERSKRTFHSPLSAEPKRSRLPIAEESGKSCGMTAVNSELEPRKFSAETVDEVTVGESLQQAGADVHTVSTMYLSDEDEGSESSGNTSFESRRASKLSSGRGDGQKVNVLEAVQRFETEDFSGEKEFAGEEDASDKGANLTDMEECSSDSEAGVEEVAGLTKFSNQRIKSYGRKSTSRKRNQRESPEESGDFQQQDQHRHEAEAHNLSHSSSYGGGEAHSVHEKESSGNSSARRTKARRTIILPERASCQAEGYLHHSVFGDCEIADNRTPISCYGNAYRGETPIAMARKSSVRPRTNSNIVNPSAQSRLLSNVRTLIPVSQRPAPNFIPNGKRDVKVKALEVAEAARRLQEKRETEKRERMQRRAEVIARRGKEKEKAKDEMQRPEQEGKAAQKAVLDTTTSKDLSAPMARAVLMDCTNSKSIQSPKSKSTRALALKTKIEEEKTKKLEEELMRKEEERRKREAETFARKRKKEDLEKKEREEKRRRKEELLKHRREQEERLRAEIEEKEHRHRLLEEAERERKAQEEEARRQRRAERERERERRQKEELEAKSARQAEKEAERKRKEDVLLISKASEEHAHRVAEITGATITAPRIRSQHTTRSTDKLQVSNLLSTGASLSLGKAVPLPSATFEGRSYMIATPLVQNKGPIRSLSGVNSHSAAAGKHAEVDSGPKTFATATLGALEDGDTGPQSYEISPYRSSSDEEDEDRPQRSKKFIPAWTSKENLMPQLLRQLTQDPDEIFAGTKTCSLKEVFGTSGSKKVLDFGRRSGSGDWVRDRVSWKEELQYKIDMGYMNHIH